MPKSVKTITATCMKGQKVSLSYKFLLVATTYMKSQWTLPKNINIYQFRELVAQNTVNSRHKPGVNIFGFEEINHQPALALANTSCGWLRKQWTHSSKHYSSPSPLTDLIATHFCVIWQVKHKTSSLPNSKHDYICMPKVWHEFDYNFNFADWCIPCNC